MVICFSKLFLVICINQYLMFMCLLSAAVTLVNLLAILTVNSPFHWQIFVCSSKFKTIYIAVIWFLAMRPLQIFANAMTAELSYYVQNCVVITWLEFWPEENVISVEFEFRKKITIEMDLSHTLMDWQQTVVSSGSLKCCQSNNFIVSCHNETFSITTLWFWCPNILNVWRSSRLLYLQCISTGDTTVLHESIELMARSATK